MNSQWQHETPEGDRSHPQALQHELIRYATLAASSHNTQCWTFKLDDGLISILPDLSRRCPAVDPDDHHLFVSLGCAAENLSHAAAANGQHATVAFDAPGGDVVRIEMVSSKPVTSPLFDAIPKRQCTRAEYDGQSLSTEQLHSLEQAGRGNGVNVRLLTEPDATEKVLEYVVAANSIQMNDDAFVDELKAWIRFNDAEFVRRRDGLFTRSSGNPALPTWLGQFVFPFFFKEKSENDKYATHIRSSAGIAVFVSETDDKAHWVEVGRSYERFALTATSLNIRNAFLNQPVEVARLRPQFASALGLGDHRPDLIVRFGYGPEMPRSLRRPVKAVIV